MLQIIRTHTTNPAITMNNNLFDKSKSRLYDLNLQRTHVQESLEEITQESACGEYRRRVVSSVEMRR